MWCMVFAVALAMPRVTVAEYVQGQPRWLSSVITKPATKLKAGTVGVATWLPWT